ncbi:hypothetical protein XANCAGTX0491_006860 [Xanthoria calcicola]
MVNANLENVPDEVAYMMAYPDLGLLVPCPGGWPPFGTKTVAARSNEGKHATANLKSKRHAVAEGQARDENRSSIKTATAPNGVTASAAVSFGVRPRDDGFTAAVR